MGERWLTEMGPALWLEDIDNETESDEKVHVRDCTFLLQPHWLSSCTKMAMHIWVSYSQRFHHHGRLVVFHSLQG